MATSIPGGYSIGGAEQIDDRLTVANLAAFQNLEQIGGRAYLGMLVFFTDTGELNYVSAINPPSLPTLTLFEPGGSVTPAITSNGSSPSLNTGISAAEVRTLIGAGTLSAIPIATNGATGGIKLFNNTDQSTAANSVTTTANRTYGLQLNVSHQGVVNVPWTDTQLGTATNASIGGIKLFSNTGQSVVANSVTSTANRTYGIQLNGSNQAVVNIPWTDNNTQLGYATSTTKGGIELFSDTVQTQTANAVTATSNRTYGIQFNSNNQAVVNVPWTHPDLSSYQLQPSEGAFVNGDKTKLDGIETNADVTDSTNVSSAGALMATGGTMAGNIDMNSNDISNVANITIVNADFTGDVTMSNNLEVDGNIETDTLTFDGVTFTSAVSATTEGNTVFGANASGSAINNEGDVPLFPSDLSHQFTGSLAITGGLELNGTSLPSISTLQLKPSEGAFEDGDKTKLDGIEVNADVTDTTNVAAAGALMDSELTDLAGVKGVTISTLQVKPSEGAFVDGDKTKLDGIEAGATADQDLSNYQLQPSEGAFEDGDKTKLDGIAAGATVDQDLSSYVTFTEASHSQFIPNPHYVSSSDVISTTEMTELSYNSIVVDNTNTTFDVATFSDSGTPQSFEIRNDNGVLWDETNSMYDSTVIASLIDKDLSTVSSFNVSNDILYAPNHAFNVIWDFNTPTIVSEFRHSFDYPDRLDNIYALPYQVFIYGKNEAFDLSTNAHTDGTLLAEGARPGQGGMPATPGGGPLIWSGPSSNPLSIYGIGTDNNLNRTSSIPETSLTSSFRYYRIRYEGTINSSPGAQFANENNYEVGIKEVTPVTRSFISDGTSISASNGVLNVTQIVCDNIIGTSSFATLANSSVSSSYALTASYVESIENFTNITLNETTVISGSLFVTSSTSGLTGNVAIEGNLSLGTIDDVETRLLNAPSFSDVDVSIVPNVDITYQLGNPDLKWKDIYAKNTFFGGIHEINLETEGLNKMQEGTVLTLRNGMMHPCENEADPLVMGVVSKGENYPIVLGAEPVLVTGKIKEGDYIITSNVKGHGKGINPQHIYSKQLFGKIIAQAIESGEGKSYTIKAMIRKM